VFVQGCSRLFKVFIRVNKVSELGSGIEIAMELTSVLIKRTCQYSQLCKSQYRL